MMRAINGYLGCDGGEDGEEDGEDGDGAAAKIIWRHANRVEQT
jgi:hypothetical protein